MTGTAALVEEIPGLRRYAMVLVRDRVAADDLVQDCIERALSRWHLRHEGSLLRPWLFTILHNIHVNQRRRSGRVVGFRDGEPDEGALTSPAGQTDGLALRDLEGALARLPDEQRDVVLLVGMQGFSYREVSDVLGVPIGTVMSRLARGREKLRLLMDSDGRSGLRRVK